MSSVPWSRAMKGWLAGCGAATAVILAFVWIILVIAWVRRGDPVQLGPDTLGLLLLGLVVFVATCVLTGLPAAAVVWLSERFAIRSIWFFGCAGAGIGVLSEAVLFVSFGTFFTSLFATAGFVAGMVYWRVAGRYASAGFDPLPTVIAKS